jgi:hypothetical protein
MKMRNKKSLFVILFPAFVQSEGTLQKLAPKLFCRAMEVTMTFGTKKEAFTIASNPPIVGNTVGSIEAMMTVRFIPQ